MDTNLAEMKEMMARIDERTETILDHQEKQNAALTKHMDQDREDFKEVHSRISRVERKQNWMLGVGSACMFVIGAVITILKGVFTGG